MKPNIVLINFDDLGYGDLGCYGSKLNRTPVIDKLAKEGMLFTDYYAPSPVCSPSRGALMTGCYPKRIGFAEFNGGGVLFPGAPIGINHNEETIAGMLKRGGYSTMIVGKWHCGDQPEFLPTNYGFDHYYGLPYSNDMGRQRRLWNNATMDEIDRNYPPLPLVEDKEVIQEQPDQHKLIERYVEKSIRFIRDNKENPFFLYFAPLQVHLPLYAPERFVKESQNGDFGACVESVDWAVGCILYELKKYDIEENTLIIITSDNGSRGDNGASNGKLRGRKGETWEGGMRVPCIMYWKDTIEGSGVCRDTASHLDLFPTFASVAGVKVNEERKIDGIDISSYFMQSNSEASKREDFLFYHEESLEAIRYKNWKLHFRKKGNVAEELYDLSIDIGENQNVYEKHPDIVAKMSQLANEWRKELGDSSTNIKGENIRLPGYVSNPKKLTQYNPNHPYIIAIYDKAEDG